MASLFTNPAIIPVSQLTSTNPTRFLLYYNGTTATKAPSIRSTKSSTPFTTIFCSATRRPEYIPNRIPDPHYVRVFDTTLRDGEQSPGASMTSKEKLDVARQLAKLGVDIIEAGFPAASKDDLEAVRMIAKEVGNEVDENGYVPVICGLARCNKKDIDASWEAVKHAKRPRIHTFIATSEIHMKHKLKKTKEEVIETARSMVSYARSLGCNDVEFSPEDAGRSDREFLYQILGEVIKAGATTLNIPDTVGYNMPNEFGQLIADIKANTKGIENVIISTHCQNDLGLSTANTLAGACAGARQVEVTVNGIGERAGNAALEEVVMALKCRGDQVLGGLYTGINTKQIIMSSKMVEEFSGLHVQPHKAIVGENAFAHESGIHQVGYSMECLNIKIHMKLYLLKILVSIDLMSLALSLESSGTSFQIDTGSNDDSINSSALLPLQLGYDIDSKDLDDLFWRFKAVAEKKKNITDDDVMALVSDVVFQPQVVWKLGDVQVTCGTLGLPMATVRLIDANGEEHIACANGTGPIDSAYKAVLLIVKVDVTLLEYSMNAVTEGIDALATTRVLIRGENNHISTRSSGQSGEILHRTFSGTGAGVDIVVSSVRAFVNALNKMLGFNNQAGAKSNTRNSRVSP
ncbi:hypothetical protein RHGRI_025760 [Rhododendron griersonianum]|uniref:2-isopropylmalate synthase n=1 Tax=Rhododendron griersonianum TaxID=479676 RepID=A0AAV6ITV6_9ERIC|nr:hypothetical protein RHGRI_025760 [Rhododendron griersonianum]